MKFSNYIILVLIFSSCFSRKDTKDLFSSYPPYKFIKQFSEKIHAERHLILRSYGINCYLPKHYKFNHENGLANFTASYSLSGKRGDEIPLNDARNLIVFLGENLLAEINSNEGIRPELDMFPFTSDGLNITIYFEDENRIHLGQGVAIVSFSRGKITYEGYEIIQYRDKPPAKGKHYIIQEETYADALDIVKKQGTLKYL